VAVQVRDDTVEVIGDQGASGASPALVSEPGSVAEHEVIDQELRAASEEVRQRGASFVGLEAVFLVDSYPGQFLPTLRQFVAAPRQFLLGFKQIQPCRKPFFMRSDLVISYTPLILHNESFKYA
jgi:hypothetical protein